jgi:starch synthase
MNSMKVLLAASEVAPIIKLGGLGDVVGSLPRALQDQGVNIDVIVPFYPIADVSEVRLYKSLELNVPFDGEVHSVGVFKTQLPDSNVDVFLLRNSRFFSKGGEQAFANDMSETEMFMFFNRAVTEFIKSQFNTYDLVHCNDWHTGLITHLLRDELEDTRPATLFTIHNIMYQGTGDTGLVDSVGFIPGQHPLVDWDIEDGDINMMLQGITSSDYINTVSPTYAREILSEKYGGGFSGILRNRHGRLSGILNGVGYEDLPRNYDVDGFEEGKLDAKRKLFEKLGIGAGLDRPVFSFVGRLDPGQKGLELLEGLIEEVPEDSAEFVVLGKGSFEWEERFKKVAGRKRNVSVNIVFDVDLARLLYAGSDFLLVPSRYEPCGLIQMMAMWYGTLPVVHGVGGLRDSVGDGVTGFVFDSYSLPCFREAFDRALGVYENKGRLNTMIKNAMLEDFSWEKSAAEYKKLYERVVNMRGVHNSLNC